MVGLSIVKERWRTIKDYPDYKISNQGNVKRAKVSYKNKTPIGKVLKPANNGNGYLFVELFKYKKRELVYIHKLVAEAFIGKRPKKNQINHKDANKSNNCYKNLEYVTCSENMKHIFRLGLMSLPGEKNPLSKLTDKDVLKIRRLHSTGKYYHRELAEMFNVSRSNIGSIINKKRWTHI